MVNQAKLPTFFLSSTIYDFKDLRGALKYHLESLGCTVLASEFNDFQKPLEPHSYEACLRSVANADYFILLIGSRVGGWFDKEGRISITQREYREARALEAKGQLRILSFVRAELWQLREERKELEAYLRTLTMQDEVKRQIANYPSKFAADAAFIADFISEVGRNEETAAAVRGKGPLPTGNWVHVFHEFRDIVAVLEAHVFSGIPADEAALRRLLRLELTELLRLCLMRTGGKAHSPRRIVEGFTARYQTHLELQKCHAIQVEAKHFDALSSVTLNLLAKRLHPVMLGNALSSRCFLEFDMVTGQFAETPVYRALYLLQEEIRSFNQANAPETLEIIFANSPKVRPAGTTVLSIEATKLGILLHLLDRWVNIITISAALARHLDGAPFELPSLRPRSPFRGVDEELIREELSNEEINQFVRGQNS